MRGRLCQFLTLVLVWTTAAFTVRHTANGQGTDRFAVCNPNVACASLTFSDTKACGTGNPDCTFKMSKDSISYCKSQSMMANCTFIDKSNQCTKGNCVNAPSVECSSNSFYICP